MHQVLNLLLTLLGSLFCCIIIANSIFPVLLDEPGFLFRMLMTCGFPFLVILAVAIQRYYEKAGEMEKLRRLGIRFLFMGGITGLVLLLNVPHKIALAASHDDLMALLDDIATREEDYGFVEHHVGWFWVDEFETDERGNIYIRVYRGGYGMGVDSMSYGWCYAMSGDCLTPGEYTEFGRDQYRAFRVSHRWYWFSVSNDW